MKLLIALTLSSLVFAQDPKVLSSFEYSRKMHERVSQIGKIKPEKFDLEISKIRDEIEKFIEHKKGVCEGSFSTIILNQENTEKSDYKLTKSEQELCYRELKALQVTYINESFSARKVYLTYLHKQRIKLLGSVREDALKQIQATFDKKTLSPKQRKRALRAKKK